MFCLYPKSLPLQWSRSTWCSTLNHCQCNEAEALGAGASHCDHCGCSGKAAGACESHCARTSSWQSPSNAQASCSETCPGNFSCHHPLDSIFHRRLWSSLKEYLIGFREQLLSKTQETSIILCFVKYTGQVMIYIYIYMYNIVYIL